ncbi:MAG: hypothetical protein ACOC2M_02415 [bacterium]
MRTIRNKRELQMLRHKLKYEEKILEREISDASADLVADLNWKVRGLTFDIGSRVIMQLIQSLWKSKKSKEE